MAAKVLFDSRIPSAVHFLAQKGEKGSFFPRVRLFLAPVYGFAA